MNMTRQFSFLLGVAGIIGAGCSSPDDGGPQPPTLPPPGALGMQNQGGAGQQMLPSTQGGSTGLPVASAGSGGAPTGGSPVGTGGAPVGAGGAPAGNGEIPIGTGLAIVPDAEGWVTGSSNGLGIQGAFTAASDGTDDTGAPTMTGSTITLNTATAGQVCVSGNLAAIAPNPATTGPADAFLWNDYWGGSLGLNLRQVIPAGGGEALPASGWPQVSPAGRVTGFAYTLTPNAGTALPTLRFTVDFIGKPAGTTYCQPLAPTATSSTLSSVVQDCWNMGAAVAVPGGDLLTIAWSIIPSETAPTPFNFCVSNVRAVVAP